MARRGFFAELQHQSRLAARDRERAEREANRRYEAAMRAAEAARKNAERAKSQFERAAAAEQKRLQKEAREAYLASREAEAAEQNEALRKTYDEIDSLLEATLAVDDFVDLSTLRSVARHPPFDRPDLEVRIPLRDPTPAPPQPVLVIPDPPTGLASLFGKGKHAAAVAAAKQSHEDAMNRWHVECKKLEEARQREKEAHVQKELARIESLKVEKERYVNECAARELEAAERNRKLDDLIANLGYGVPDAVQEYVSIVLSNSAYPEVFPVTHEFEFLPSSAELHLRVAIPEPGSIPSAKAYKYSKSTDEVSASQLSQKECRERYAGAVAQVALRSFHEVFESDRRGLIRSISLEVGTNAVDPGTGQRTDVTLVYAAAEREQFLALNLAAVIPAVALEKLGASISKNPYGLAAAERPGVRRA